MSDDTIKETPIRLGDGWVRLVHWSIVILIPTTYLTARAERMDPHILWDYTLLTLVISRILWGVFGSETARFWKFLRSPIVALAHLGRVRRAGPDRGAGAYQFTGHTLHDPP